MRSLLRSFPLLALLAAVGCLESTAPTTTLGSDPTQETFAPSLGVDLAQMTRIDVPEIQRAVWYKDLATNDTGTIVKLGDTLSIHYTAWIKDGTKLLSTRDNGASVAVVLNQSLITGWLFAVPGIRNGGKRLMVVPSALAYGPAGNNLVPPNSTIIYEVQVLRVGMAGGSDPTQESFATTLGVNLAQMTRIEVPEVQRTVFYEDLATNDTGRVVAVGDTVTVQYTLWLRDGTKIQSTRDAGGQPFTSVLATSKLIQGWVVGLPGMRAGGRRRLVIPSALGYGSLGSGNIPPHSTLVFDIEVSRVGKPTQ